MHKMSEENKDAFAEKWDRLMKAGGLAEMKRGLKVAGLNVLLSGTLGATLEAIVGHVPEVKPHELQEMLKVYMVAKAFVTYAAFPGMIIAGGIAAVEAVNRARTAVGALAHYVSGHYHGVNRTGKVMKND